MSRRIGSGSGFSSLLLFVSIAAGGCGGGNGTGAPDAGGATVVTESPLDVGLQLVRGDDGATSVRVTTRDHAEPVRTDVWLYTLAAGQLQPITELSGGSNRRSPRLFLPATIGGAPSGLAPADDGRANGVMTDDARATLSDGELVSAIDGTVEVTLAAAPTDPIVVVAAVEDQRYAGAAAILPDGSATSVPPGVGVPETHPRRSYQTDVAPIIEASCVRPCHNATGPLKTPLFRMSTWDELVNDNFAFSEQKDRCETMYPNDAAARDACIRAITRAAFLVEPGAPALSGLLTRTRPDEEKGASALGLAWFGGGKPKSRYSASYGDRRMPSTTMSTDPADWTNAPTYFDLHPEAYQVLYDWVAQGAQP